MSRPTPIFHLLALALTLAGTLLVTAPAAAQRADSLHLLRPGKPVRVWTTGRRVGFLEGELLALDSTTLTLGRLSTFRGVDRELPLDSVRRLDVRVRGSRRLQGALTGAGVGGIALLAVVAVNARTNRDPYGRSLGTMYLFYYGTPVFVGTGAVIGALGAPGERWARVR